MARARLLRILVLTVLTQASASYGEAETYSLFTTRTLKSSVVNRDITNPLTDSWLLAFQNDTFLFNGSLPHADEQWGNVFQFAPSIAFPIPHLEYHIINQLSIPVWSLPKFDTTSFKFSQQDGLGDVVMANYFARTLKKRRGWTFGLGPTWIFPSATAEVTGQHKYQVGPATLVGFLEKEQPFWAYVSVQQWWSIGGPGEKNTNQAAFQYFYQINLNYLPNVTLPGGLWAIGAAPVVTANWKGKNGNTWSVPVGTGIVYTPIIGTVILPRLAFEFDYYAERREILNPEWNFRVSATILVAPDWQKVVDALFG